MVTALSSTRLIAAQLALKVLTGDDASSNSGSGTSETSSLLDGSNVGKNVSSLPSSAQASLASMLNNLSSSQSGDTASTDASATASADITTTSFMALLKQNLTATASGSSDGAKQAKAMLDALDAGTLTVSDPTHGVSIKAWDPTAKSTSSTTTATPTPNKAETIPSSDWNDYLKAHLQRNADGTLSRAADNSFIDKTTGNDAYFGQVGTQFYYLSWTAAAGSDSKGTIAANAASA